MNEKKLLIATSNQHKIAELSAILLGVPFKLCFPSDFKELAPVEEGDVSYFENASKKAVSFSLQTGIAALADDTGLEIDFFGGRPGPLSSRFFDASMPYRERNERILEAMKDCPDEKRTARFVCCVVIAEGHNILASFSGELKGKIALSADGAGGFGYDPIFYCSDLGMTLAALPRGVKNKVSHRAKAMAKALEFLKTYMA